MMWSSSVGGGRKCGAAILDELENWKAVHRLAKLAVLRREEWRRVRTLSQSSSI